MDDAERMNIARQWMSIMALMGKRPPNHDEDFLRRYILPYVPGGKRVDWYIPKGILPLERGLKLIHLYGDVEVKKLDWRKAKKLHKKGKCLILGPEFG
jgi:hypothetical protein